MCDAWKWTSKIEVIQQCKKPDTSFIDIPIFVNPCETYTRYVATNGDARLKFKYYEFFFYKDFVLPTTALVQEKIASF